MSSVLIGGRKHDGRALLIFCLVVSKGADGFRTAQALGTQSVAIDGLSRGNECETTEISYSYVS